MKTYNVTLDIYHGKYTAKYKTTLEYGTKNITEATKDAINAIEDGSLFELPYVEMKDITSNGTSYLETERVKDAITYLQVEEVFSDPIHVENWVELNKTAK